MNAKIKWDGTLGKFESFMNKVEGHMNQTGLGHFKTTTFMKEYLLGGNSVFDSIEFQRAYQLTARQARNDSILLCGALQSAISEKHHSLYGIMTWHELKQYYGNSGSEEFRIEELEGSLNHPYTTGYNGGIPKFIDDFRSRFSELEGLYYECKKWGLEVPIYVNA